MIRFVILLMFVVLLAACTKERQQIYSVQVENHYFERVESITINDVELGSLNVGETTPAHHFAYGSYLFRATTESNLLLEAPLFISGTETLIQLKISPHGALE